jgi:cytochrome P450
MGRLSGTVAFHRDPLGLLARAQGEFGDIFTIRLATTGPVVVIAIPDAVEQFATLDNGGGRADAHAGQARRAMLPMASPLSVFGADEQTHSAARARTYQGFAPEIVNERAREIETIVHRHIASWPRARPTRLLPLMRALADEVFVREVLGVRREPRTSELVKAIGGLLWTPGNPPLTVPAAEDGLLGRAVDRIYRTRREPVARLLEEEIADRRLADDEGPGVLGLLLGDEPARVGGALVEELLALLMAAQEPMAAALTWLALHVGGEPEIVERLRRVRPGGEYEHAVIQESLRLHPPAVGMLRTLSEPAEIAGHVFPAGTSMMAPIPLLHRDPRSFTQPESFLPDRHLSEDHISPAAERPSMWPFGSGARRCIAEPLARTQLGFMLRAMLEQVTIKPSTRKPERMVLRATILVPQRSGLVRVLSASV